MRMWITAGRSWLAATVLAIGTAQGDYVTFTWGFDGSFDRNHAIIDLNELGERRFNWTANGVVVQTINLYSFQPPNEAVVILSGERAGPRDAQYTIPSDGKQGSSHGGAHTAATRTGAWEAVSTVGEGPVVEQVKPRSPQNGPEPVVGPIEVRSDKQGGWVRLNSGARTVPSNHTLYFEAIWNGGSSFSRNFTAIRLEEVPGQSLVAGGTYNNAAPHRPEQGAPAGIVIEGGENPTSVSGEQGAENTQAAGGPVVHTSPKDNSPVSSGGLQQGAIIGIAVGCGVAGLILIFALAWWLLRRRQKKKALGRPVDSSYGSGNRADELMAEKEAAADVDVTPHSPYSDDGAGTGRGSTYQEGATAHVSPVAAGAVAAAAVDGRQHLQDPPRSFTPYSDRPSAGAGTPSARAASLAQTDEARVSAPSPIPGRATPRALTTPYAHLVEEGMTEEEIRRLEEEERQLDAAIEQAGRR